jgi:hypothetical protein
MLLSPVIIHHDILPISLSLHLSFLPNFWNPSTMLPGTLEPEKANFYSLKLFF